MERLGSVPGHCSFQRPPAYRANGCGPPRVCASMVSCIACVGAFGAVAHSNLLHISSGCIASGVTLLGVLFCASCAGCLRANARRSAAMRTSAAQAFESPGCLRTRCDARSIQVWRLGVAGACARRSCPKVLINEQDHLLLRPIGWAPPPRWCLQRHMAARFATASPDPQANRVAPLTAKRNQLLPTTRREASQLEDTTPLRNSWLRQAP